MYPRSPRGRILPKISTMPRQASEASSYLDLHKLVIEKRRLQQELEVIEQRKQQINARLETLTVQIDDLKVTAEQLGRESDAKLAEVRSHSPAAEQNGATQNGVAKPISTHHNSDPYDMVFLDY